MTTKRCLFAKSDDTPCVIRDGSICYAANARDQPICVGCERTPKQTGIPVHATWAKELADYKRKNERSSRRRPT